MNGYNPHDDVGNNAASGAIYFKYLKQAPLLIGIRHYTHDEKSKLNGYNTFLKMCRPILTDHIIMWLSYFAFYSYFVSWKR